MKNNLLSKLFSTLAIVALSFGLHSCEEDDPAPLEPVADFSFTVTDLTVAFQNDTENGLAYIWDFGDGFTTTETEPTHTYASAGDYEVKLTAIGEISTMISEDVQTVRVEEPPLVNLISGGTFEAADASAWNVLNSGQADTQGNLTHVKYDFGYTDYKPTSGDGGALYIFPDNDGAEGEEGTIFYQQIDNLEAGNYRIEALIRCGGEDQNDPTSKMNQYWFEIVLNKAVPLDGDGYNNGRLTGWIYGGWTGWAFEVPALNGTFPHGYMDGSLANSSGEFTLSEAGTYYLVIKAGKSSDAGGASFGEGIALDNLVIGKVD